MDMGDRNFDVQLTNSVAASATVATEIFTGVPSQGTTQATRQGREITNVTVEWKWDGTVGAAETGGSPLSIRFIVDTQANGTTPGGGITPLVYTTNQISGLTNLDYEDRFVEVDRCDIDCVGAQGPQAWQCEGFFNLDERVKLANVAGGSVAACGDMAMYCLVFQNGGLVKATADTLNIRMRFQVE